MSSARPSMRMPELLVFARAFCVGLIGAEVFRLAYYGGTSFAPLLVDVDWRAQAVGIAVGLLICLTYALTRDVYASLLRLVRSARVDLLAVTLLGLWSNELVSPWLAKVHKAVSDANPLWVPTLLGLLLLTLVSPLWRTYRPQKKLPDPQLYFLTDDEIETEEEDILENDDQAKSFADTVMASGAHSGLVFGIDGPWGTGKTSFLNLAEQRWRGAGGDSVIVFRFEPLRYASDPDLSERLIRELSATIQRRVFVPEFQPAASRYSRMLKGKADLSFLGFKLSLEPSSETIDELLEDIDDVLKRIRRRVIIIVDDLDRLEAKMVNNVLFTVRRTFKLSQATYILCYDTENLVGGKDEGERARGFLEKFVNVKLSLFVDSSTLRNFLLIDWKRDARRFQSIPADTMLKLSSVLSELADILNDDTAAKYAPLIGDLRKLKRFVNAVLLMQIEKTDLGRTDFNRRDLVNLMLLHLNYPGIFRRIYAEETEGRSGVFSAKRNLAAERSTFSNADDFESMLNDCEPSARFLLEQLFDVKILDVDSIDRMQESVLRSRACFNREPHRNLEKYLRLIVRFATPEPRETFKLYQDAVDRIKRSGTSIAFILDEPEFRLQDGDSAHDQFWRVLVSQSFDFTRSTAEDAINTLVEYLPRYSSVDVGDRGLRQMSIYSLILLLDRAGWGRTDGGRLPNTKENLVEIAQRIFGEGAYREAGLIYRLASDERGVLGWYDLMLFRLQCSADRQGQVFNVHSALILHEEMSASTSGQVSLLAVAGMRVLSQRVFEHFKRTFIEPRRNYLAEVDSSPAGAFYGDSGPVFRDRSANIERPDSQSMEDQLLAARSSAKSFVVYQLANRSGPNGSGVGCGLYDESGTGDAGGISALMNAYLFEVCFNPLVDNDNIYQFADYCLRSLNSSFWSGGNEDRYVATEMGLVGGLDPEELKKYWLRFGPQIKQLNLPDVNRRVVTLNHVATYSEDLPKVFVVLDNLRGAPLPQLEDAETVR
ncbi:MAG: P-loop NTPase fold protein [Pseudomonadales bacterium]